MQAVILAGGFGTRISEETEHRPKPMVEIGGRPILWHIMKLYTHFDVTDFIVCLGYRGYCIKEYFANYFMHMSDVTFDLQTNGMQVHANHSEPWKVTLIDTGLETMTGGRLKRIAPFLDNETFCFTYGDGLSDVDVRALVSSHREAGRLATLTAVRPPARYGALEIVDGRVRRFEEKPLGDGGWINGGFFVLEPGVLDYIAGDATAWEREPLEALTRDEQLHAYYHQGFWHAMDTLRDRKRLEALWAEGTAPWRVWGRAQTAEIHCVPTVRRRTHQERV